MENTTEHWLPISGLDGRYEISTHGNVRAVDGTSVRLQHYATKPGGPQYWRVRLPAPVSRTCYVHRLVLETFEGPCPNGMQCRHLNGNPGDNRLVNLKWGTPSEDNYDRIRHGTHQHTKRTECRYGHPLDGVVRNPDGTVRQRVCLTCRRKHNREMKEKARAARTTCPQGHPFDGIRYKADGTVRQRYCTICAHAALEQGRINRWARDKKE